MSNDKRYNGWRNYETWCVSLWLDNEEGTYETRREMGREAWENAPEDENVASGIWTVEQAARFRFADVLKDWVNEMAPDLGASIWADLLGAALSEVDWNEIAEHWLEDDKPEAEAV